MKKITRGAIYVRFSSHRQEGSFSVEYQIAECKKYMERHGWELAEIYVDEAKSGKKTAGRDDFDRMMIDASHKKFDKIVVFSFSRSFRNTRDALNYNHELMEKYGIMIVSVIEQIDMSDPHGKFSGTNLFAMHELQSDIIAAHVKSGMYFAAQQGYYLGGFVPFGYETYGTGEFSRGKERKKFRPHKAEAEIVKEIFELFTEGLSIIYIQEKLRERGVLARKGDIICKKTVRRILKSPFYIGTREFKVKGYEPLSVENAVPPLIDMETWNKAQARLAEKNEVKPRRTRRLYSLTGKITCAKCGGHMHGCLKTFSKSKTVYTYYQCSNKKSKGTCDALNVRKDHLDEYCLREIKKHILNEKAMREISAKIATAAGDSSEEMAAARAKAERRREKIAAILKKIKRDEYEEKISADMAKEMSAEYERELLDLENSLISLNLALESAITPEGVYSYLQELLTLHGSNNEEIQKMLFDKVIESIIVHDNRIEVNLIVFPFAHIRGKETEGQPRWRLGTKVSRDDLRK